MNENFDAGLFLFWLAASLLMMTGAAIALLWAVRSGQFKDQDRARYLALWSGIPEDEAGERGGTNQPAPGGSQQNGDSTHV